MVTLFCDSKKQVTFSELEQKIRETTEIEKKLQYLFYDIVTNKLF